MMRDLPFASAALPEVSPKTEACTESGRSLKWPCRPEGQQQIPTSSLMCSTHRETLRKNRSGSRREKVFLYLVLALLLCISHGQQGFNLDPLTQCRWSMIDSHILFATDAGSSATPCVACLPIESDKVPSQMGKSYRKGLLNLLSVLPHASHLLLHLEVMGYMDLIVRDKFKREWP